MAIHFEVKVPNGDVGESLGIFKAEALPRAGERFCIYGCPAVCRGDDAFIAIVDEVWWEAGHPQKVAGNAVSIVWLREERFAVTIYCVCTEAQKIGYADPTQAECSGCGKERR